MSNPSPEPKMPVAAAKALAAECLGTFALVFAGTGAIVFNDISGGVITYVGVALTFGLVVMTMIYAIGDVSGAHINPAVTIGFWAAKRMGARDALLYIVTQCVGGLLASGTLWLLAPQHVTLGATIPAGPLLQSFVLELVMTFMLMFVVLSVSTCAKEKGITAGIAIGGVIAWEALMGGPISGASMNPARSLAPALVSGHMESVWLYVVAPIAGSCLAVLACRCIREKNCCSLTGAKRESRA